MRRVAAIAAEDARFERVSRIARWGLVFTWPGFMLTRDWLMPVRYTSWFATGAFLVLTCFAVAMNRATRAQARLRQESAERLTRLSSALASAYEAAGKPVPEALRPFEAMDQGCGRAVLKVVRDSAQLPVRDGLSGAPGCAVL